MKQRKHALAAAGLILAMLTNAAPMAAAAPAAQSADLEIDPYTIDWVVKYEENFDTAVEAPAEWVEDTYQDQEDIFFGDNGYAEQWFYGENHSGASLEMALEDFSAFRKSYSFGQDGWLTVETYGRGADPDTPPETGGRFIIDGDGKAVMVCEKHTDAAIIGSTDPLPSTYRLEVTVKNIDVGGLNMDESGKDAEMDKSWGPWTREEPNEYVDYEGQRRNGYFSNDEYLSSGPWVDADAASQNGMYFLGIVDYGNPRPHNNTFIHYHRKLAFDTDNNGPEPWSFVYDAQGNKVKDGSRYISMLWLDAYQQGPFTSGCKFFSYTSKDGGSVEEGATMVDKYLPGEEYTFAVIRTPESYTMEVTGRFYHAGQHTYTYTKKHIADDAPGGLSGWTYHFNQTLEELNGLVPPNWEQEYMGETREDWPEDATYPDYFYLGIPHINFYAGTAEFTNITLKVPKGSADDPAMNVKETVKVTGVKAENKVYDGKAMTPDAAGLSVTLLEDGTDLTETLAGALTYTWYSEEDPDRALSITPKGAGSYILKAVVDTTIDDVLYRGSQEIPFTISKATVTIAADNKTVEKGGAAPEYTYTVTGLAEGDELAQEPTVICREANLNKDGRYTIKVSGAALTRRIADNYNDIVYRNGTLTVGSGSSGGSVIVITTPAEEEKETPPSTEPTAFVKNADGSTTYTYEKGVKAVAAVGEDGAVTAQVTLPEGVDTATITIPMEKKTSAGTVAVLVKADGSEEILRRSVMTEKGMTIPFTASGTVRLVDRSQDFDDVAEGHWAASAVAYVSSRELFKGTGDGRFSPELNMTRGMLLTVLARLDGADTEGGAAWYDKGLAWAEAKGVSNGENPEGNITREELAILLWRYAGKPEAQGSLEDFRDAGQVSSFAEVPFRWAVEKGIINGKDGGYLDPQGTASRAEVAAMLERFVKATV